MTNKKIKNKRKSEIKNKILDRQSNEINQTLWNNPMVENAKKSMTKEQLENFRLKGESLYNTIDFVDENGKSRSDNEFMIEGLSYIVNSIKSGLHLSYLDDDEKKVLQEFYGEKWYEKFGYENEDTYRIKNFYPNLQA